MMIGSWKGIASQVSLPHISVSFRRCFGGVPAVGRRAWTRWQHLPNDLTEQARHHGAERRWGLVDALLGELLVSGSVERGASAACRRRPRVELIGSDGADWEMHVGKTVAAE